MGLFDKFKQASISTRMFDEKVYELVIQEIEIGIRRDGLWAQALAKSEGDEQKARAFYINLRAQSIKDEIEIEKHKCKNGNVENTGCVSNDHIITDTVYNDPVNGYDNDGFTPLMRAVQSGDLKKIYKLLNDGADPLKKDKEWGTTSSVDFALRLVASSNNQEDKLHFSEILRILKSI